MKLVNHIFKFICILMLLLVAGCQEEIDETITEDNEDLITADSVAANLLLNVSTLDGSFDNIIDTASCLNVQLPVTVIVNGVEIIVDSEEDFEVIEAIFDEFEDDEDNLEIEFPITIILSDFSQILIEDEDQLEDFVEECNGDDEDDDDIECIDIQYPITIQTFDANNNLLETITLTNDESLYQFFNAVDPNVFIQVQFPITFIFSDGTPLVINNLGELITAIQQAEDDCDEDDDNDYDDDDNTDIGIEDLSALLMDCPWNIDDLERDDEDLDDLYEDYLLSFLAEGVLVAENETETFEGEWTITLTDNGPRLEIVFNDLPELNNNWRIHDIEFEDDGDDDGTSIDLRLGGDDRLELEQNCDEDNNPNNPDISEEDLSAAMFECFWRGVPNGSDDFNQYEFYFNEQEELVILHSENDGVIEGTWGTASEGELVFLEIDANEPLDVFDGIWQVTDFDSDRIEFIDDDNTLVLERECEDDNQNECFEESQVITICDEDDNPNDGTTNFNVLEFCDAHDAYSFYESFNDAQNQTNPIIDEYTNLSNPQTLFVRFDTPNTSEDEIFEIAIQIENCQVEANLDLEKVANEIQDTNGNGTTDPGDTITYSFSVTNNGNVVIYDVTIDDSTIGISDLTVTPADLAPGVTAIASITYTLTSADIAAGSIINQATATGSILDNQGNVIGEVSDDSDDPTDSTNEDFDNDGDFEDPTITEFPQPTGLLTGLVFEDVNGDGVQDVDENGIADVDVEIEESNGNILIVTTDFNGNWTATVPAGDTTIDVDESTLPNGGENYVLVTAGSDPETINVEAGMTRQSQDDGYQFSSNISPIITQGDWIVANYNDSGVDETDDYANYILVWNSDNTVNVTGNSQSFSGTWFALNNDSTFTLNFDANIPFDEFNDDWDVVSVTENRLELRDVSGGDGSTDILVFEKL